MSTGTPPEKKPDQASDKSEQITESLNNANQLAKTLESFVEQLAKLIVTRNWVSLLLLTDAVLVLFCFPGGILAKFINATFGIKLPQQYPVFFWFVVGGVFVTALVIAIRKISQKPPSLPDFTERKAIKGLRAFTREDAELFARLEREKDLRECLESITSKTFRIGILMGESGVGKSSFLQAGIIPQLAKEASSHRGVYIRFSNQEPITAIKKALAEELQLPATESTATNNRDLLQIFSLADKAADKTLILIFDQFEQFFVHFKQKQDREPFVNALKDWYCGENPLPIKILISVREDLSGRLIELQKALGYSLSPYEVFRLEKFSPESATKILQVIAEAEAIPFDEKFMLELTRDELASREDGLISPVDLQILAKTIERQESELQAFNRSAFQKIGGIEGLMTRFLKTTLDARVIPRHREAAIKVLLAMTDLDRNVRAGALTIEEIQQKTQGTLTPGEIVEAITWLASGGVRLITAIGQDSNPSYELAHERLIPALREEARRELTSADRANQLLDRRVNEWLGNQRSNRYLFNWQELRSFQQQKPYRTWGANKTHKENLLKRSWQKLTRQLTAIAMVLVLGLVGIGWWHTPGGQIQQVRWELAELSKRVSYKYRYKAAFAFSKSEDINKALEIINSIENLQYQIEYLIKVFLKEDTLTDYLEGFGLNDVVNFTEDLDRESFITDSILFLPSVSILENILENYIKENATKKEYSFKILLEQIIIEIEQSQEKDFEFNKYQKFRDELTYVFTEREEAKKRKYLEKAIKIVEQLKDPHLKANGLINIIKIIVRNNFYKADKYLEQATTIAEQINSSSYKNAALIAITQAQVKFSYWQQAHHTVSKCPTDECKVESLAHILTAWAEKKNPALIDKEED